MISVLERMSCVSAPVCCGSLHVDCASAQSRKRIVGLGKTHMNQIFAMSDPKSESSSHQTAQTPKLEPFSRDKITRGIREPTLLRKAEKAIMDRCSTLDGEESFSCWETFFEFEKMKEESEELCNVSSSEDDISDCQPLEQMENLVRQSGGVKSLIGHVSMIAKMPKQQKEAQSKEQIPMPSSSSTVSDASSPKGRPFLEPDELPKSQEELEEEERERMPDSPYTKMLRRFSIFTSST